MLAVGAKETPFSSVVAGVGGCGSDCSGRRYRVALVKKRWVGQRTAVVVKRRGLRQDCNAAGGKVSE